PFARREDGSKAHLAALFKTRSSPPFTWEGRERGLRQSGAGLKRRTEHHYTGEIGARSVNPARQCFVIPVGRNRTGRGRSKRLRRGEHRVGGLRTTAQLTR